MWERIGWIDIPSDRPDWWASHMSLPFAIEIRPNELRVLMGTRDSENRSSIGWVDIALSVESVVLKDWAQVPLLTSGTPGAFDENGVSPSFARLESGQLDVWYFGWALRRPSGWWNSVGRASGLVDGPLTRISTAPTFDRSVEDPYSLGYPYLVEHFERQHLFYSSYSQFGIPSEDEYYEYDIKLAVSSDGESWERLGPILYRDGDILAQSRPSVIVENGKWNMWYCAKGSKYQIYSAKSTDGLRWEHSAETSGLIASGTGGERVEVCYPHVLRLGDSGDLILLYNGDNYGKSGFGVARWLE